MSHSRKYLKSHLSTQDAVGRRAVQASAVVTALVVGSQALALDNCYLQLEKHALRSNRIMFMADAHELGPRVSSEHPDEAVHFLEQIDGHVCNVDWEFTRRQLGDMTAPLTSSYIYSLMIDRIEEQKNLPLGEDSRARLKEFHDKEKIQQLKADDKNTGKIDYAQDSQGNITLGGTMGTGERCGKSVTIRPSEIQAVSSLNQKDRFVNYAIVGSAAGAGAATGFVSFGFWGMFLEVGALAGATFSVPTSVVSAQLVADVYPNLNPKNNERVDRLLKSAGSKSAQIAGQVVTTKPCETLDMLDRQIKKAQQKGRAIANASPLKGAVSESTEKSAPAPTNAGSADPSSGSASSASQAR